MKRKTETKIQSKYQLFVALFIIIRLFYIEIVAVDEKFTVFNICRPIFQICYNKKGVLPLPSFLPDH